MSHVEAPQQREALIALYGATNGEQWTQRGGWNTSQPLEQWHGVTVDNGYVVKLDLSWNGLEGSIPGELGSLEKLEVLSLGGNKLTGNIPPGLGDLENLRYLALHANKLTGNIPKELGGLTNLTTLYLHGNHQLSGTIPLELGELAKLRELYLSQNSLEGSIPPQLGGLEKLEQLHLHENQLTGSIPKELGGLTNLQSLDLQLNKLNGPIPATLIGRLGIQITSFVFRGNALSLPEDIDTQTHLTKLDFSNQGLSGRIPWQLGQLSNLRELRLDRNRLEGNIPPQLGSLENLIVLDLNANQLTGSIPKELGGLPNLVSLTLSNNRLTGNIPKELGKLAELRELHLWNNQLSGNIPKELGDLTNLTKLSLWVNALSGNIPPELGRLQNLQKLSLFGNNLEGSLPPQLGSLENLTVLNLQSNRLSGSIPKELGSLKKLDHLDLSDNKLTGPIPAALIGRFGIKIRNFFFSGSSLSLPENIDTQTHLTKLELSTQGLVGRIPPKLGRLQNLAVLALGDSEPAWDATPQFGGNLEKVKMTIRREKNLLTGSIPPELGGLQNLEKLYLNDNKLTGEIPSALGDLKHLQQLSLAGNQLSGEIPSALGDLKHLQQLSLARNQLSGSIPKELGSLEQLEGLNLYYNRLEGNIPPELGSLEKLVRLDLERNQLTGNVPPELGSLEKLETLDLRNNELTGLGRKDATGNLVSTDDILRLLKVRTILLDNNPFTSPPLSLVGSDEALLAYFDDLSNGELEKVKFVKAIFLGREGSGKTSLMQSLRDKRVHATLGQSPSTVGVEVAAWEEESTAAGKGRVLMRVFDCGGQPFYHALHRVFLKDDASLVLLWDSTRFAEGDANLGSDVGVWMEMLTVMGPLSNLCIVGSKTDAFKAKVYSSNNTTTTNNNHNNSNTNSSCSKLFELGEALKSFWYNSSKLLERGEAVNRFCVERLAEGGSRITVKDNHLVSCEGGWLRNMFGDRWSGLQALRYSLHDMASTRVVGAGLASAMNAVRELSNDPRNGVGVCVWDILDRVLEGEKQNEDMQAERRTIIRCALKMMENEGEVVVLGELYNNAPAEEAVDKETLVILNTQWFAKIVSPLLTPWEKLYLRREDGFVVLDKIVPYGQRRAGSTISDMHADETGAKDLVDRLGGSLTAEFARSLWGGVMDDEMTLDQAEKVLAKLRQLDIVFVQPSSPTCGEPLRYKISWRMPDANMTGSFGPELQRAATTWCTDLDEWKLEVVIKLERPLQTGVVEELVASLANSGFSSRFCWRQGGWFQLNTEQSHADFRACVLYEESQYSLRLRAFGARSNSGEGGVCEWAAGRMLFLAARKLPTRSTHLRCPICRDSELPKVQQPGHGEMWAKCSAACHKGKEDYWTAMQTILSHDESSPVPEPMDTSTAHPSTTRVEACSTLRRKEKYLEEELLIRLRQESCVIPVREDEDATPPNQDEDATPDIFDLAHSVVGMANLFGAMMACAIGGWWKKKPFVGAFMYLAVAVPGRALWMRWRLRRRGNEKKDK